MRRQQHLLSLISACLLFSASWQAATAQTTYALLIGVGRYDDDSISDLNFIVNDVQELEKTLRTYGKVTQIEKLHDETFTQRPTKANIEKALATLTSSAGPQDQVIFFYSGHGFKGSDGRLYLVPAEVGVLTITTCSADQTSMVWEKMRQSLFSYWLTQGLKGNADWRTSFTRRHPSSIHRSR